MNNVSKYGYVLVSFLLMVMAVCMTACGEDEDKPSMVYKANGRGVEVNWDGDTEEYYFFLSTDRVIMVSNREEDYLRSYPNSPYKMLTDNNIYQYVKEALMNMYDVYPGQPLNLVVNASTNWNEYPYCEIRGLVEELMNLKNKYTYITFDGKNAFFVFNWIPNMLPIQY